MVKLMISMVATGQWDQAAWFGQEGHENSSGIVMMHTDTSRAYCHAPCKEETYVELPEYGRLRVSLYGTRDAAANWEDAYPNVLREHQFDRGVACPCSFYSRVRGIRTVVHGDGFISGGPRHQLKWLE